MIRGWRNFIEKLKDVPDNHVVVFSAHGTAPAVFEEAKARGLTIIDATCPLVTKVHRQATRYSKRDIPTILIGHKGHQELIGTSGYVNKELLYVVEDTKEAESLALDPNKEIAILTQTTLSVDDTKDIINILQKKFPNLMTGGKKDICYATQNRQDAVKELTNVCDVIIVCGSENSSNSNRLKETAERYGAISYIIDKPHQLKLSWLDGIKSVGITSGASVPFSIIEKLISIIKDYSPKALVHQKESVEKNIVFPLPESLKTLS